MTMANGNGGQWTTDKRGRRRWRNADGSYGSHSDGGDSNVLSAQHAIVAAVHSALLGRSRIADRAGIQFGGERDIAKVAGYVPDPIDFRYFWSMYKRDSLAGRIVDMPAKTTWRTPPEIVEPDAGDETAFMKAFNDLAKRLRLWHYFERVDRLAGVGRYAVLLFGTRGDTALKSELSRVRGPDDIIYLAVYSEGNAAIDDWERDVGNERFMLPTRYKLTTSVGASTVGGGQRVEDTHWSRVIHVAEDKLEDEVYGRPRLERVLNRLFDLDKVSASTAESYWQMVVRILQAKIDLEAELPDGFLDDLDEKLTEMIHDLRRQFSGQGVELSWLNTTTPNVSQVAEFYFSLIAGGSGIPKRILFGSELGELASTTDQATYLGSINERQEQFVEPEIVRQFIDRMIDIGALPEPGAGEYQIIWPTLFEEPEADRAEANLKRAQTAAALAGTGGDPLALVEITEEREVWLVPREPGEPLTLEELAGPLENDDDEPEPGMPDDELELDDDGNPIDDGEPPDDGEPTDGGDDEQPPE